MVKILCSSMWVGHHMIICVLLTGHPCLSIVIYRTTRLSGHYRSTSICLLPLTFLHSLLRSKFDGNCGDRSIGYSSFLLAWMELLLLVFVSDDMLGTHALHRRPLLLENSRAIQHLVHFCVLDELRHSFFDVGHAENLGSGWPLGRVLRHQLTDQLL